MSDQSGPRKSWEAMTPRDFDRTAAPAPEGVHAEPMFPIPDGCGTGDLAELLEP